MEKFAPLIPGNPCLIHGGDYNPDQWLGYPDILKEDVRLMKVAGVNSATVAIFAWAALEPREGEYHFEWLDEVFDLSLIHICERYKCSFGWYQHR